MKKMNLEAKAKIVAALRSGEYQKATGKLRSANTGCYCVWGVICAISGLGAWDDKNIFQCDGDQGYGYALPPRAVQEWTGLDDEQEVTINGVTQSLMAHNDTSNATFEEMATAIEEQL